MRFLVSILGVGSLLTLVACGGTLTGVELHGEWGGVGVRVTVSADGATLRFDCAAGTMDARPDPGEGGRFVVTGTHTAGVGLPVDPNNPPEPRPARYDGEISGRTMTFSITYTDTDRFISSYRAVHGREPDLTHCL